MRIYKRFTDGVPEYLARYYWWAYLWRWGIWFFDRQPIINAILFGQYEKLLKKTQLQITTKTAARILQLTCVYGKFTPSLLIDTHAEIHLCDAALGQLKLARHKTEAVADRCHLARMNAENLAYCNEAFDQVIVFFLLHEMPVEARSKAYSEIARVVRPEGSVLITEYASTPKHHWLYRFVIYRRLICHFEPFLADFWQEDVSENLGEAMMQNGKKLEEEIIIDYCFGNFYRIMRFNLMPSNCK